MTHEYNGKPATIFTIRANARVSMPLPFNDRQDFQDAYRGRVGDPSPPLIRNSEGRVVWDMQSYQILEDEEAPDSIHPSLYRQALLNHISGLFEVTPGIYQVRGYDLSNMTIVESEHGIIVIDPLISCECAEAALALYQQHRVHQGKKPHRVMGVIYTHSHLDHFGGVEGIITHEEVARRNVPIIAPHGFLHHVVSENVHLGPAMVRRSQYTHGMPLPKGERLQVDAGIGKTQSTGRVSLIAPTMHVEPRCDGRPTVHTIDGVDIHFQLTPHSEAPAEMNFYFPDYKAMCMAENATHNMHSLVSLRGALVRDGLAWSKYLDQTIELFCEHTDVLFAQHHWPRWKDTPDRLVEYLGKQRDLYRYLHDQSVRLINRGYTGHEIAEHLELPESLAHEWHLRGYYGSLSHNVKGVYQRYLGWFDGHPAHLHALPPAHSAPLYVAHMGGPDAVMQHAQAAVDKGDYRWAAELLTHVVYANPDNVEAKEMQADVLEQLGYQSENASWRNFYLMGAHELRQGVHEYPTANPSRALAKAMTLEQLFDNWGVRLHGPSAAQAGKIMINFVVVSDRANQSAHVRVTVQNGALSHVHGKLHGQAEATVVVHRDVLNQVWSGALSPQAAVERGSMQVTGDLQRLYELCALVNGPESMPDPAFPMVTPRHVVRHKR